MTVYELSSLVECELYVGKNFSAQSVNSVSLDSGRCGEGVIFAAVKGARCDGADFVGEAYSLGTRVFLSESVLDTGEDTALILCRDLRKSIAPIAAALCGNPQKSLKIIGITGTKGKTTTGYLISALLSSRGVRCGFIGTLGVLDDRGRTLIRTDNTTPDPTVIFPALRQLCDSGVNTVVIEVSSQALKQYRVYSIPFYAAVFTSLGVDHIGKWEHESFAEYAECKRTLFTSYGARVAFVNADDEYSGFMASRTEKCIKCGFSSTADYRLARCKDGYVMNGIYFSPILMGDAGARNIALAVSVCRTLFGFSLRSLLNVAQYISVPGRLEYLRVRARHVIIDYAHNAMSFREVISAAAHRFSGRVFLVFGAVGDRSRSRRSELARVAEELADYSIITTDDSGSEEPLDVCSDIYRAFSDRSRAEIVLDRERAIRRAFYLSSAGDVILLLGKGHEQYMNIKGKKQFFSERRVLDSIARGRLPV